MGAGACAGTGFAIRPEQTARALGFDAPLANALDAVSSRDFALEYLAAAAICATTLSRLGAELVLWSSAEYGFVKMSDSWSSGSSIMPQKRNPDAAELLRAKAGRVLGDFTGLLATVKGLPLAYAKDLQEDKEALFDATDTLLLCLAAGRGMLATCAFDRGAMAESASGFLGATDLADYLVREKGLPFRESHKRVARLVAETSKKGKTLDASSDADLARCLGWKNIRHFTPAQKHQMIFIRSLTTVEAGLRGRKLSGRDCPATGGTGSFGGREKISHEKTRA